MNRILTAGLLLALLSVAGWWLFTLVVDATKTEMMVEQVKLIEQARIDERALQEKINDDLKKQAEDLEAINTNLTADIAKLRKERPARSNMPQNARADCKGANGLELAGEYAEFLVRYSARAAEQDAALKACYAYADSLPR